MRVLWPFGGSLIDPETFEPALQSESSLESLNFRQSLMEFMPEGIVDYDHSEAVNALARFEFRGKRDLWFRSITNRMVSRIVLALTIFLLATQLHLIDSHLVLILVYLTFTLLIVVWLCSDQFWTVPRELDEAAFVDGLGLLGTFFRVALPLALPGIVVSAILSFIFS